MIERLKRCRYGLFGSSAQSRRISVKGRLMAKSRRILEWNPEDHEAWEDGNEAIAARNLIWSIVTGHVAFSIWYLWSVIVLFMPQPIYGFSTGDKLLMGATASLVGAVARIPYAIAGARLGGRNWAIFSSAVLLIPTAGTIVLLAHPGLPVWPYLICAALTGLGGANYSSSLATAEAFYPQRLKGFALGLTGGIVNLGAAAIQAVGLLVLATAGHEAPYWVCAIYLLLLAIGGVGAALFMNNLRYRIDLSHLKDVLMTPDAWGISLLYLCFSGSFLGFAFAFGQVLVHNFTAGGQSHGQAALHAAEVAFIGPLLGSLARIVGGRVSDRYGGGPVSLVVSGCMIAGGGILVALSTHDDLTRGAGNPVSFFTMAGYIVGFIALFIFAGAGKGAVYKLIPSVFEVRSRELDLSEPERRNWARVRSGALIGFAGSFGALGGMAINLVLRQSYNGSGTETPAFWIFLVCYIGAAILAWRRFARPHRATSRAATTPKEAAVAEEPVRT